MISPAQYNRSSGAIPVLRKADPELAREFQGTAIYARIPAGRDVFSQGDPVESIALLLSGRVRVYKIGETGREITLYRFGAGESCILTANAILSRANFPAIAVPGRSIRILAGIALIALGLFGLGGATGVVLAVIGAVPLVAGLFNFCLMGLLVGGKISARKH
jgi:hypothetical protein